MGKQYWKPGTVLYPLPAVMVSSGNYDTKENMNIITIAWTGIINTNPPQTYISIKPERHSFDIIKKNMEFVINLTTKDLAKATDFCGVRSGKNVDKFDYNKVKAFKSKVVSAPSIYQSPINLECKVFDIIPLESHHMFLADIVSVTVDDKYFDEKNTFLFNKSNPICYSHGAYYTLGENLGKFGFSVMKKKKKRKVDRINDKSSN